MRALEGGGRVFAYLDDIVVVVQPGQVEAAHNLVRDMLAAQGLALNTGKTAIWCRDAGVVLPPALAEHRRTELRLLGSDVRFLDRREDRDNFGSPIHGSVNGEAVIRAARGLTAQLRDLPAAGLGAKAAFTVLQTYAQSCSIISSEPTTRRSRGLRRWRGFFRKGWELVEADMGATQRAVASLRLKEAGLALGVWG